MNISELKYHGGEILAVGKDGLMCRNGKGEFCNIPFPRFANKQIVKTTSDYFSPKSFTRLIDPTYTENRGWIYGENYIDREGMQGGCGYSFEEKWFTELEDVRDILIARRLSIKEEMSWLNSRLKTLSDELSKAEYAIQLTSPPPNTTK